MGSGALGLCGGYFPDEDETLWVGVCECQSVALEYVCPSFSFHGWWFSRLLVDFVLSKVTPQMVTNLGYKLFLMFATVNVAAMGLFFLYFRPLFCFCSANGTVLLDSYRRQWDVVLKRWISFLELLLLKNDKSILKRRQRVRYSWPSIDMFNGC